MNISVLRNNDHFDQLVLVRSTTIVYILKTRYMHFIWKSEHYKQRFVF